MIARHDFATRLRLARALLARGPAPLPVHLADQLDAAASEIREAHDQLGAVIPLLAPDRRWYHRSEAAPAEDTRAYLLAAALGCTYCCHLRRGGPQPAFVRLPLRRADCARCVQTLRRPPADEADRCDVCGARGVVTFHPFAVRNGPALVVGDACQTCAGTLGIRITEEAS